MRDQRPERGLGCRGAPGSLCNVGTKIHCLALDALLTVPCVLVKGEPGDDGKPGRPGIPGSPGEKVGEVLLRKHPLPTRERERSPAPALASEQSLPKVLQAYGSLL